MDADCNNRELGFADADEDSFRGEDTHSSRDTAGDQPGETDASRGGGRVDSAADDPSFVPRTGRSRLHPVASEHPLDASPAALTAYEAALPDDPDVERKRMFGVPCAFVNRQMFFGTFENSVVARVGPERAEELAGTAGRRVFTPTEGRPWRDYVQVDMPAEAALLRELATEALVWTRRLPPKLKTGKKAKAKRRGLGSEFPG